MKLFPKTIFAALLAAAVLIICAAGCAASPSSASLAPFAQNAQDGQNGGADIPASSPAAAPGGDPETDLGAGAGSPGASSNDAKQRPIRFLGEGMPLGDGNEAGYYYLSHREDASFNIKYVDYASCTEIYLCSRPECTHDNESCAAWRPYCGSEGSAIPIGENLYLMFYGSQVPADHARYGELAKLHIEKAGLDGSDARQLVSLPASASLSGGLATDGQYLYMAVMTVEKTENDETRCFWQICAVDLQNGGIAKSETMDLDNLAIVGAAGRKLILSYYTAPSDGMQSLSDIGAVYCTYDVDSGRMDAIDATDRSTRGIPFCAGEYLCWIDREQACLQKRNVFTGETVSLPFQMDVSRYEDIRPSYNPLANYALILLYEPEQPEQHGLISLESGKIFLLTMEIEAPEGVHNRTVPLFAEINGEAFLTARAFSHKTVLFPLANGDVLGLQGPSYELALLPVESCLANRADFVPIRRLEP